jgi:hypothetical protein
MSKSQNNPEMWEKKIKKLNEELKKTDKDKKNLSKEISASEVELEECRN